MSFNLDLFGKKLRKIRATLDLTLNDVSKLSGVNSEALRRIEKGKVIPKFETLEFLSPIYKQDLNALLLKYRLNDFSAFHDIKNRLEAKFDRDESGTLDVELNELRLLFKHIKKSYYKNHIEQLMLLTKAVTLYKDKEDNNEALDKLIEAMKISDVLVNKKE